jgi:pimeloyl-ACP methyl ester carboxylesterase
MSRLAALLALFALSSQQDSSTSPRLFVHRVGQRGPLVILLHGLGATNRYFTNRLDHFASDHRVLAPDLLGFGSSPRPKSARYDLDDHVRSLAASLPQEPALLVGHSFGAVVALACAARFPSRVRGVVVISLPVFRDEADARSHFDQLGAMVRGIVNDSPLWRSIAFFNPLIASLHAGALVHEPDDVYVDSTRHSWDALSRSLRHGLLEANVNALAHRVRVPILFIHGSRDQTAPVDNALALAHDLDARVVVVDDNHDLFLHDPAVVWREVRAFPH